MPTVIHDNLVDEALFPTLRQVIDVWKTVRGKDIICGRLCKVFPYPGRSDIMVRIANDYKISDLKSSHPLIRQPDVSLGGLYNIGCVTGYYDGTQIDIVRRIDGESINFYNIDNTAMDSVAVAMENINMKSVQTLACADQAAYVKLLLMLNHLRDNGFDADALGKGNLLFNHKSKEFGLIDITIPNFEYNGACYANASDIVSVIFGYKSLVHRTELMAPHHWASFKQSIGKIMLMIAKAIEEVGNPIHKGPNLYKDTVFSGAFWQAVDKANAASQKEGRTTPPPKVRWYSKAPRVCDNL